MPIWRTLFWERVRVAWSRAREMLGRRIAIKIAIIPITTSNSTSEIALDETFLRPDMKTSTDASDMANWRIIPESGRDEKGLQPLANAINLVGQVGLKTAVFR